MEFNKETIFKYEDIFAQIGNVNAYDVDGILMAYDPVNDIVGITQYDHCSCYDTMDYLYNDDYHKHNNRKDDNTLTWGRIKWDYIGYASDLKAIFDEGKDYSLEVHSIQEDDYDFKVQKELRSYFQKWFPDRKMNIDVHFHHIYK